MPLTLRGSPAPALTNVNVPGGRGPPGAGLGRWGRAGAPWPGWDRVVKELRVWAGLGPPGQGGGRVPGGGQWEPGGPVPAGLVTDIGRKQMFSRP